MLDLFINMNHVWIGTELLWGLVINQHVRTRRFSLPDASHNPLPPEDFPTAFAELRKHPVHHFSNSPSYFSCRHLTAFFLTLFTTLFLVPQLIFHLLVLPFPLRYHAPFFFHTLFLLFLSSEPSNHIMSLIQWG